MPNITAPRLHAWLPIPLSVMTVITLTIDAIALYYVETRMVATVGETLAIARPPVMALTMTGNLPRNERLSRAA